MHKAFLSIAILLAAIGCAREETAVAPPAETSPAAQEPLTPEPRATEACALITEAEASEALAQAVTVEPGGASCVITPQDPNGITVDFFITDDEDDWRNEAMNAETISNLGDAAVWTGSSIAMKKGDRYLIAAVSKGGDRDPELKQKATAFARLIESKL